MKKNVIFIESIKDAKYVIDNDILYPDEVVEEAINFVVANS